MLHTKSQGHRPSGSGEDFLRVFTIYGHGSHLGHVTKTIWTNFRSPILRSLHMKYEFNWPSSFREDVWKCWRTTDGRKDDGRRSHWYTISSPMSLWLRWAKKIGCTFCISFEYKIKRKFIFLWQIPNIFHLVQWKYQHLHSCKKTNFFHHTRWNIYGIHPKKVNILYMSKP